MYEFLAIPDKIVVGQHNAKCRFTGKLSLPTYKLSSGKLLRESYWRNFKDGKSLDLEIDNIPTEGFEINKIPNGQENEKDGAWVDLVVYDPRGFEFKISERNLLHIVNYCSIKDKKLEGKFVYSWNDKELMLLSVNSPDYKASMFTKTSTTKITARNLIPGATYKSRNGEYIYLGKLTWYFENKNTKDCITFYSEDQRHGVFEERPVKEFLYEVQGKRLTPMELQDLIKKFQSSRAGNNSPCEKIRFKKNLPDVIENIGSLTEILKKTRESQPGYNYSYVYVAEIISDTKINTYTLIRRTEHEQVYNIHVVGIGGDKEVAFDSRYYHDFNEKKEYEDLVKRFSKNPDNFIITQNSYITSTDAIEIYTNGEWINYINRPYGSWSWAYFTIDKN